MNEKHIVAFIPARGGSKSIPRKNIKMLGEKPLIAWSIEAAQKAGIFSRIIVTTDDKEIADVAKQYGAEVPFMRPEELAQDTTPTLPVLQHAVTWLAEQENYKTDLAVLLEPTSPFRQPEHVQDVVELLVSSGADSVVTVREVPGHYSPYWQFSIGEQNQLNVFTGGPMSKLIPRRQALPKTYTRNGAVYAFKAELLLQDPPSIYGEDCRAVVMEPRFSVDLDTPEDWVEAEKSLKNSWK